MRFFLKKIQERILKAIRKDNFTKFLFYHYNGLFLFMKKDDIIQIFSDPELRIIKYIVKKLANMSDLQVLPNIYLQDFHENGLYFSQRILNYVSNHIKAQVENIAKRKNPDEISVLKYLNLLRFLEEDLKDSLKFDYTLRIYMKQGDDLAWFLGKNEGEAKEAILDWAYNFKWQASRIRKLVNMFENKELEIHAESQYIFLVGDIETLEKAVDKNLVQKEERY